MKTLTLILVLSVFSIISIVYAEDSQEHSFTPKDGFIPDRETAIQIAEAVWIPIYGREQIENEKPFNAILKGNVWTVSGSMPKSEFEKGIVLGGVAIAEISKKDGCILRVSHGK